MCHNMPHPLNPTEGVIAGSQYMCYIGLMSLNCPSFNFPLSKSLSMCQGSQILLHLRPLRPQRFQGMMLRLKGWLMKGTKLDSQRWKEKPTRNAKHFKTHAPKSTDKAAEKVEKLRQVGSQEIFQGQPARTSAKTMPTSATTKPAGKGPRKLKGKGTCAKKGKSKCKKATAKKKQHAGSKAASLKNPPKKPPSGSCCPHIRGSCWWGYFESERGIYWQGSSNSSKVSGGTPTPGDSLASRSGPTQVRHWRTGAGHAEQSPDSGTDLPNFSPAPGHTAADRTDPPEPACHAF